MAKLSRVPKGLLKILPKKQKYAPIALNPDTLKPLTGDVKFPQKVVYGIVNTKSGTIRPIYKERPQRFTKRDFQGLNRELKTGQKTHFVAFEEKTRYVKKDAEGKIEYVDGDKARPKKKIKVSFFKPKTDTYRPVEIKGGKKITNIETGFQFRSKYEYIKYKIDKEMKKVNARKYITENFNLKGNTLAQALGSLNFPFLPKDLKKMNVDRIAIAGMVKSPGQAPVPFHVTTSQRQNMNTAISAEISRELVSRKKRFTTLKKMNQIVAGAKAKFDKAVKSGNDAARKAYGADYGKAKNTLNQIKNENKVGNLSMDLTVRLITRK